MNMPTTNSFITQGMNGTAAARRPLRPLRKRISRGQAAVEFGLISVLALAVMLLGIQYALIGQAAVAVSQGSSALARWAASSAVNAASLGTYNGSMKANALPAAAQEVLSQSILTHGGADLTVFINSSRGEMHKN